MNPSLLLILAATTTQSAYASKYAFMCKRISGNLPRASTATLTGPTRDFDFRIRIMNASGMQIETGLCDISTKLKGCFTKDMYGDPVEHETGLAVRFKKESPPQKIKGQFQIEVLTRDGSSIFSCEKQR